MISKLNMKRKIGRKLGDYRRSQKLRLDHVAKQSWVMTLSGAPINCCSIFTTKESVLN